ncbi:MAG: PspA/IM30 family protein [Gemmatimonadota bacterium]
MSKSAFGRMADIVKSNINELLDRIEDPEKMVRQMVLDMEDSVNGYVGSVGTAVANQRRLRKEQDEYRARALEFAESASRAVAAGDDELARRALERKVWFEQAAIELDAAIAESRQVAEEMKAHLQELRAGLREARSRQGSLIARCRAARVLGGAPEPDGTAGGDPFSEYRRLEQRIAQSEGQFDRLKEQVELQGDQAEAEAEIRGEAAADRKVDRRLEELATKERVDQELAALRERAGKKA